MNEKIKKFSLFDWFLVAVVILVIAAGGYYVYKLQTNGSKCEVVFKVEFKWVDESFINSISEAPKREDDIKDSIKGYYLGKAVDVEVEPDKVINFDETTGKFVEVESPGKYTVYLTVKGHGVETGAALLCEGQAIRVGSKMSVKGKGYAQTGFVTELFALKAGT